VRNRGSAIFVYKRINKGVNRASGEFKCFGLIYIYPPITAEREVTMIKQRYHPRFAKLYTLRFIRSSGLLLKTYL